MKYTKEPAFREPASDVFPSGPLARPTHPRAIHVRPSSACAPQLITWTKLDPRTDHKLALETFLPPQIGTGSRVSVSCTISQRPIDHGGPPWSSPAPSLVSRRRKFRGLDASRYAYYPYPDSPDV